LKHYGRCPAQQLTGHHHALDLLGSLVDLGNPGVTHHALDREVPGLAIAAGRLRGSVVTDMAVSLAKHFAADEAKVRSAACRADVRHFLDAEYDRRPPGAAVFLRHVIAVWSISAARGTTTSAQRSRIVRRNRLWSESRWLTTVQACAGA
jgi:hypothetical protein